MLTLLLQAFPFSVLGIVLRGVCLMRPQEICWMFGGGAAALKPLGWTRFLQPLSPQERLNPLAAYYKRLLSPDAKVRSEAVSYCWSLVWVRWMQRRAGMVPGAGLYWGSATACVGVALYVLRIGGMV